MILKNYSGGKPKNHDLQELNPYFDQEESAKCVPKRSKEKKKSRTQSDGIKLARTTIQSGERRGEDKEEGINTLSRPKEGDEEEEAERKNGGEKHNLDLKMGGRDYET